MSAKSKGGSGARKRRKMVLGKGLEALIPEGPAAADEQPAAGKDFFHCPLDDIVPNPYQPRLNFSAEELRQLADSVKAQGVLQPLLVRPLAAGGYELVAGERRLRAARLAGLNTVPVVVKDVSDAEMIEMSIVENIQRENLNPMEEAEAYHRLITEFDLTQEEAAARVGKSRSAVANFLRLRQLPEPIKASIMDGKLSMGHARALLGAETPAHQTAVWRAVIEKGLSVRQTEAMVRKLRKGTPKPKSDSPDSGNTFYASLAEDLSRRFGTKVQIKRKGKVGKLEIEFYNDQDLQRVLDLLDAGQSDL